MKKVLALVLCLVMLLSALPFGVDAAVSKSERQLISQIRRVYEQSLEMSEKESLRGYCGLMAGLQLYFMGINRYVNSYNGKDQYDAYAAMGHTSGGCSIRAYSAERYTLEQALNRITDYGTKDVYNVLVGFEQTTTQAGTEYGHVVVIHGILDGYVYFVEGFYTSLAGPEGTPIKCTIAQFARFYSDWTTYEGLVVFNQKDYTDKCTFYPGDLYVRVGETGSMLATLPGGPEDEPVRMAAPGERLYASGLYCNTLGQYFYRIEDEEETVYVRADDVTPVWFTDTGVSLDKVSLPEGLKEGRHFRPAGKISSSLLSLTASTVRVLDFQGNILTEAIQEKNGGSHDLSVRAINNALRTEDLPAGAYTYQITATVLCHYYADGQLQQHTQELELAAWDFTVGDVQMPKTRATEPDAPKADGWSLEEGAWYYYLDGQRLTGWICDAGMDYYLDETGAAATGWTVVNGQKRFFSSTGSMRTGWVETVKGSMYLMCNGAPATGKYTTEDGTFFFNSEGLVQGNIWVTEGENRYFFMADGTMATGWVHLPQGSFCFREDGRLFAKTESA